MFTSLEQLRGQTGQEEYHHYPLNLWGSKTIRGNYTDTMVLVHSSSNIFPPFTINVATEMWCLGRFLPLLVGDVIPEGNVHWEHYLQLLQIINYLFAPRTSLAITQHMAILIEDFLSTWLELYPSRSLTPKMPYLVHLPAWTAR